MSTITSFTFWCQIWSNRLSIDKYIIKLVHIGLLPFKAVIYKTPSKLYFVSKKYAPPFECTHYLGLG